MIVWMVNPFDPLPGDLEQEGRYATLTRLLTERGHKVVWWTSNFSHRFKKPVDQQAITAQCKALGIEVRFLLVPPYQQNVGLKRLWNHWLLSTDFRKMAKSESTWPDVVIASMPPPMLLNQAVHFAKKHGAKAIVDIQDLWPETFYRLGPKSARPLLYALLLPWRKAACKAYKVADALVGVADSYVKRAVDLAGPNKTTACIPLGIDLAAFDAAAAAGICEEFTRPPEELWFVYAGSLNISYDCLTVVRGFAKATESLNTPTRLFITSRGILRDEVEEIIRREKLTNVTLTGFLNFPRWAYLLSQCDVGFNSSVTEAMIYLPNKIFYYFAASLAVLNTITGQCSRIIHGANCGLDYQAGNVDSCAKSINLAMSDRDKLLAIQCNSRRLAESKYDRRLLYTEYAHLIERLGK
ncbi:MAG: glycosyltransferase family 4 protein [Planctomycetota bacterium]|jgi:glycosyltransferase involved in cell wall biosynthesis